MDISQGVIINEILREAVQRGAADIHFSVGSSPVLRINNELVTLDDRQPVDQDFMERLVDLLLEGVQKKVLEQNKEIVFAYDFDKNLRFKVSVFYQKGFLSATLRYIPAKAPDAKALGLSENIINLAKLDNGLVIVAGPFGSGRSTTITALIEEINKSRRKYIITIEDPIEYLFTNRESIVEQREVGRDTRSFFDALHYFQEEDGDVLFLEEMDDPKVIPLALEIAHGGSLVFASLTADSAVQAIAKIIDSFESFDQERIRDMLATSLRAVVCQKLVNKIGGGQIPAWEVLLVNDAVRSIIGSGAIGQLVNIIQTSKEEKMVSLDQSLADLVSSGSISRDEALSNAANRDKLTEMIK